MPTATTAPEAASRPRVRLAPEDRREQILREATRLIARSGFNGISLAAVAEACGLRKPSVLHYFPSMVELLKSVLLQRDEQDFLVMGSPTPDNPSPEAVGAFFRQAIIRNLQRREVVRLFLVLGAEALDPDHPAHAYFAARAQQAQSEVTRLLAWRDDPAASAVDLLAFWEGIALAWVRDDRVDLLAAWDRFSSRFFG